jgi:hypothetical protein
MLAAQENAPMTMLDTATPARPRAASRPGFAERAFHAIPLVGWIARDISRGVENVFYALVILLTLLVLAVMTWGLAAITLTAVALVPVIFVLLFWITLP